MNLKKLSYILLVLILGVFMSCGGSGDPTYTVTYDGNGNTGGVVPVDANNYLSGAIVTVASVGDLVKTGKAFYGWNTAADGSGTVQAVASTFAITTAKVTLYAQWRTPIVSDTYQGGVVAYILSPSDFGYDPGVQHGLIASTVNQGADIAWALPANQNTLVTGTLTTIGSGSANTDKIIAQNIGGGSTYAAGLARAYTGGGYSDWYLPSKDELNKLYLNKGAIGGFVDYFYWSSSDSASNAAQGQSFGSGGQLNNNKIATCYVRAVRSF